MKIIGIDISAKGAFFAEPIEVPDGSPAVVQHPQHIEEAVRWLMSRSREELPRPLVPALRERFGLSAKDACAVLREFGLIMGRAT